MSHPIHHLDIPHHQYFWTEVLLNNISVNLLRSIYPPFYQCNSINPPLPNLQYYFKETETAIQYHFFPSAPQRFCQTNHDSSHIYIRNCLKFRSPHWNRIIHSLQNLLAVHDTTFTTTDGVIIITLCMSLARVEDKAWECGFIHPYGHRFIQS